MKNIEQINQFATQIDLLVVCLFIFFRTMPTYLSAVSCSYTLKLEELKYFLNSEVT